MLQKLIAILLFAAVLMLPVTALTNPAKDVPIPPPKPAYIVELEDKINAGGTATVDIIRHENDGETLWLWIDSDMLPNDCDFAMVLEVHPTREYTYKFLTAWSDKTMPDSCEYASMKYDKYVEIMNTTPKKGDI
jgi:hypothetical protein